LTRKDAIEDGFSRTKGEASLGVVASGLDARGVSGAVALGSVLEVASKVPGAGAARVRALVEVELADVRTRAVVEVQRTRAVFSCGARLRGWAVTLGDILEFTRLVGPGAGTVRVRTLVTLEDVDPVATVAVQVGGARAAACSTEAHSLSDGGERRDDGESVGRREHLG